MDYEKQILIADDLVDLVTWLRRQPEVFMGQGADDHGMVRPRAKRCLDIWVESEARGFNSEEKARREEYSPTPAERKNAISITGSAVLAGYGPKY